MSVEVVVFASVEELVAVTVAPGIGVLPDFTTPVIEKLEGAGASCPNALIAASRRRTTGRDGDHPGLRTRRLGDAAPGIGAACHARTFL